MIKILYYIPNLSQNMGGVRQYAANLLRLLSSLNANNYEVYVYHNSKDSIILNILNENKHVKLVTDLNLKLNFFQRLENRFNFKMALLKELLFGIKQKVNSTNGLDDFLVKNNIDIVHCPYQFIPKLNVNVKTIVTMHDVQELHYPHFFSPYERAVRAQTYNKYIKNSDAIVVSYDHVKADLIKFFQINSRKIFTCLLKMDQLWFKQFNKESIIALTDFNLPENFLFFPANTWEHKNHKGIIEAVNFLKISKSRIVNFVFTGNYDNPFGEQLKALTERYKIEDQIKFLGVVDEKLLYTLYQEALGIVVPTLYEAGSFPLMESILMERPVICSNVTSLPETIGNTEFIFNPTEIKEMANMIEKLFFDASFREKSVNNSKLMQDRLIDTGAAEIVKSLYNEIV